jgi:Mn2+/Fe2+ NRAMP family transporter
MGEFANANWLRWVSWLSVGAIITINVALIVLVVATGL